ncbi:PH domain-containing protein [Alteriqipengyuania lutimaris]|uniref:YdbS-like PH domain-containing protein n=1 Tax=Alteriqipengyuania lutimaris TaxID=1538146 RepID=A0A395LIC5_9SPHN|nr:PH domain-containing protein [Alteriqipengyuania lutimaris]MBB3034476.1 putative membrane protein [Alteriqipengyuania lutimaris]RDS76632.1 hypothetical protein DL238_02780 [Alteriqipengyuania lutimaris]
MTQNPSEAPARPDFQEAAAAAPEAAAPEASDAADGVPKRTDPRTFLVQAVEVFPRMILPLVAIAFTMRDDGPLAIPILLGLGALFLVISTFFTFLAWWRLTYRVGESDIRLESGLLSRAARSVPYDRIQDVSLEQGFVPRLFGLTMVKFETGAGGSDEIKLAYLTNEEGAALRELVRELRDEAGDGSTVAPSPQVEDPAPDTAEAPVLFAMGPRRLFVFGLFEFSLALVAFLGAAAQQVDFILPFDIWDFETWQRLVAGPGEQIAQLGPIGQALGGIAAVVSLLIVGLLTGIIRTFTREWDFRLERNPKGFRRRRGLFTRTDVVMPVHRVQAVRIGTGAVRHRFGWKSLMLVSLAQDSGNASHVVAPFAKAHELTPILKVAGFPLPPRGLDWHRTTASYRIVSAVFGAAGYALLALIAAGVVLYLDEPRYDWGWLVVLGLVVLSAFAAFRQIFLWHVERHALSPSHLYKRSGWLAPGFAIADRVKLQSVEISRGPLGRLFGYVTVNLGLAGGSYALPGITRAKAEDLRAALLASMVETDFSRLVR